ncbi:pyrroline-5-carboxylate reductase [Oceanisphaera psychrotolerans]|uniref:Pyrroline-5-carboxylate reductase n=1 Tax=Oceanisphaera psychrotolerans TaxID=1414654 RepID=A0A1J4QBT5_9GAMM|nr:pyrroline-5-carboxylate reductase [Oceanisphaera psychrotolerans]OIN07385.1 pyrroline-5-carboxylate reductase [Oceanisphaera psychrotolerans]
MENTVIDLSQSILVVGGGRMGGAIVHGWLRQGVNPGQIHLIDRNPEAVAGFVESLGIVGYTGIEEIPAGSIFDFVLLATKPQVISEALPVYRAFLGSDSLLISIAAGISSDSLSRLAPGDHGIVRVMPNTPALISRGVMVGYPNARVSISKRHACEALFISLGEFYWVENEEQMHGVTAVSGSGPAYLFHFVESMIAAAEEVGLPKALARELAIGTVVGAARLVEAGTRDVSELRKEVTSPKGTTEAALNVLMGDQALTRLLCSAIDAAATRSRELAVC